MAHHKIKISTDGFEELIRDIEKMGGNVKESTEKALTKTRDILNDEFEKAMIPHNKTGRTVSAIKDENVVWDGLKAQIPIGFDIKGGGMASIFLMFGTKVHGTPRTPKDQKLYNVLYGSKTQKILDENIGKILQEILEK